MGSFSVNLVMRKWVWITVLVMFGTVGAFQVSVITHQPSLSTQPMNPS